MTEDFFEDVAFFDTGEDAVVTSRELSVTRSKLGDLLDLLPAGLLIHQEQGAVYANLEAARILGLDPEAMVGRHFLDFVDERNADAQAAAFRNCVRERTPARQMECAVIAADGRRVAVHVSMAPLPWDGLPVIHVLMHDLSVLKEKEEALRLLSITDPLTGAYNRRHFVEFAEAEVARSARHGRPLALLALDIDHFKAINDTFGHCGGDEALRAFTAACRGSLRVSDMLGRLGGEEFAVLLPETGTDGALTVAEHLRSVVEDMAVPHGGTTIRLTVSIGVARFSPDEPCIDSLLSRADKALYRAKREGRNRAVLAERAPVPEMALEAADAP